MTNDESNLNKNVSTKEIENKRKEMVHKLLNAVSKLFKFSVCKEGHPKSPRIKVGENDVDNLNNCFYFNVLLNISLYIQNT